MPAPRRTRCSWRPPGHRGHDVIIVDERRDRIDDLRHDHDCDFLHGDATLPKVLKEADLAGSDFLFCLAEHDQTNILSALVGRSLGFAQVVTSIQNPAFEELCHKLGLRG